ncbi:MAG: 4Fe-4S binding protein, partial [Candidatus Bathyarchaeia archaeon]
CFNDIRSFGKGYEEFYKKARSMGINFLAGIPSEVRKAQDGTLSVIIYEKIINKLLEIHGDMVVLACGLIPGEELSKISEVFRIPRSADGFLLEAHPKLRPLETSRSGIFLAGACQGPKDIPDSVAQASGAAAKVIDLLLKGEIDIEPLKAVVNEDFCSGCRICESVCPFDAISIKTDIINGVERPKAQIIDVKCQGCGVCSSTCPTRAIEMQHYTYNQISAQIHAALAVK